MIEQQLAAVKQALAALEGADQIDVDMDKAITALQSIISQDALYKMAEDAVTIGLSYNDWPKIGCVNHDCDKCKAVQEPVGEMRFSAIIEGMIVPVVEQELPVGTKLYTTPPAPQPVPVKTYHDGKPWPVAPKPWVGLTDEEIALFINGRGDEDDDNYVEPTGDGFGLTDADLMTLVRRAEAKLKEKNT